MHYQQFFGKAVPHCYNSYPLERSHSWSSAHDWKSCTPKGVAGSNPALSVLH